jgi:hypothetical protein
VRKWLPALAAGAVLMVPFGVAAGNVLLSPPQDATATIVAAAASDESSEKSAEKPAKDKRGTGPPSWAGGGKGADKAWQQAWKGLSPADRSDLMKRLGREHAAGMKAFEECVAAGGSECEKPLPPGHAKRL